MDQQHLANLAHLRRARDLVDREYARPLDVPTMARHALMSPGHFSRAFRAAYGETPYSYLMTRRVERAMALLRAGIECDRRVYGGRLHLPRLVQLAIHRDRGDDAERVPGPRAPRRAGDARVRGQGAHPASQGPSDQDWRSGPRSHRLALAA